MTTVAEMVLEGKRMSHEGRELTTNDVIQCAHEIEKLAVATLIARSRITETTVRQWLSENRKGTVTTHQEFNEAVRRYLIGRWDV